MILQLESSLDRLVEAAPLVARVFARHGIEFCCGADRTLASACRIAGVDPDAVLGELRALLDRSEVSEDHWQAAPVGDLLDHILDRYHGPLAEELPRLERLARRLALVHRQSDGERLMAIHGAVRELRERMLSHLPHEEQVIFPALRAGEGDGARRLAESRADEGEVRALLARLSELTDGYSAGGGPCNSRRALFAGLAALHEETERHIHLEHEVLETRLLAG
jgi:regulator of cell morphogenesis and NO signaling